MPNELNPLRSIELIDRVAEVSARIKNRVDKVQNEEQTKMALVLPFIEKILGYDPYDPHQILPEYTADVGMKKGEKVDFAIMIEDEPAILIEAKKVGTILDSSIAGQLQRYFTCTTARFGVITNGVEYKFFSDLEEPNKMDSQPFFEFNILNFDESQVEAVIKFSQENFNLEDILGDAENLKYKQEILDLLDREFQEPSEDFMVFIMDSLGVRKSQGNRAIFKHISKSALNSWLSNKVPSEQVKEEKVEIKSEVKTNGSRPGRKSKLAGHTLTLREEYRSGENPCRSGSSNSRTVEAFRNMEMFSSVYEKAVEQGIPSRDINLLVESQILVAVNGE